MLKYRAEIVNDLFLNDLQKEESGMIYAKERAEVIAAELKKLAIVQSTELNQWKIKEGTFLRPEEAEQAQPVWQEFDSHTMHWYGKDRHYWFKTTFVVPESWNQKPLWFRIHTGIDGWDDARNPQFLLFINGQVTQGMDINHREVLVDQSAKPGTVYEIDLQAYTGIIYDEFRLLATVEEIDPEIAGLYYDMQVPLWSLARMDKESRTAQRLAYELDRTVQCLDLRNPYSKEFYESVTEARSYIQKAIYEDMGGYDDVIATCIGHTHIDVAWWWTVAQTREKVCRSFSTVLKLMEEYPDYKFMSSQPQLYAFFKERYPEMYEKIKERVKEGRWEPEGGMWVEADCNLTSGESLVRQFLHGKKFFKDEFGVENEELWLPDVFGYSAALPQIMKKSGIKYFMTTKLAWNQFNKHPNDTFLWEGIDGTKIFTHLITTLGIGQSTDDFFTTYNGMLHPDALMGGWLRYQNKEINNDILIAFGYGDGGGGPTREMMETSARMEKGIQGTPKVRQAFSKQYFEELTARIGNDERLATWVGELYFEYHRGTYTSMARNKRSNRKSEFMMMDLELLSVLLGKNYPAEQMDQMWKTILINQFHDILPGSSIKEVYEVTKQEYDALAKQGKAMEQDYLHQLTSASDELTLFNTVGFERNSIVSLPEYKSSALKDADGNYYPVQKTEDGAVASVSKLPSKGYRVFQWADQEAASPFVIDGWNIETPFYKVSMDEGGCIVSLYDTQNEREVVQEGKKANQFRVYEDKPQHYDNWDVDIYYNRKFWDVTDVKEIKWVENGPVRAALYVKKAVSNSMIEQTIYFYADEPRIDFDTHVDWKDYQQLLKVHFPVDIHTDEATFDIQFGNLTRKTHKNTSWDIARFETCGHKWMDVSEGGYGVSILNDCKYGHSVDHSDVGLTLIKSGIEPNPTTDQEDHYFTYAIYPHAGTWREADTLQEGYDLNQPVLAVNGTAQNSEYSFISCDKNNVMLETVKPAEDGNGIILRVIEEKNTKTKAKLHFAQEVKSVCECDLMENKVADMCADGKDVCITIAPYEIKTYRVNF